MKTLKNSNWNKLFFTILRITVGWHFLYEGISKLAHGNWSSAPFLQQSKWLFAGLFHQIVANPTLLKVVDFCNIWGLILIGTGLVLGVLTRIAGASGMMLLLIYYVASPPFFQSGMPVEGHYFIVNKNLIEAVVLMVLIIIDRNHFWGIDNIFRLYIHKQKEKKFPAADNHEILDGGVSSRREMIKNLAVVPVFGGAFWGMAKKSGWLSFEEANLKNPDATTSASGLTRKSIDLGELKGKVPMGNIKGLQISRIIPGGNLVSGFAHSRDLIYVSPLIKTYFTDEKVIETLWLYEACGINTTVMRADPDTVRILKEFWRRGGKIQWLAQTYPKGDDLSNVNMAIDAGASGAFVMGSIADKIIYNGGLDDLAKPIEYIRSQGLIGGTGAHSIKVPQAVVDNNIEVDFFMKTFHHDRYWSAHPEENRGTFSELQPVSKDHNYYHDNLWCISAEETSEFFKKCEIPWIAYKVLAAGAIKPEDGIRFAYEHGADFTCVGMFDFQVIENANLVHGIINSDLKRERKWVT